MVFSSWDSTEGINAMPASACAELRAIVTELCVEAIREPAPDWPTIQALACSLDEVQRSCSSAYALTAQQDLIQLWQRLDDVLEATLDEMPIPEARAKLVLIAEDISTVVADNETPDEPDTQDDAPETAPGADA